ncbi:tetratricopeptide repeat (TPR)-like superfamily protein [Carex rostrata]
MKISELSPDLNRSSGDPLSSQISDLESLVVSAETHSSSSSASPNSLSTLATSLRRQLTLLAPLAPFPDPWQLHLWKLSFRLWNACIDLSNSGDRQSTSLAELRQCTTDMLLVAGIPISVPSATVKAASFLHRTGLIWHELGRLDRAAKCFEKATDLVDASSGNEEEIRMLLDLNLARSQTAWDESDKTLAIALLNRSKPLLLKSACADAYKSCAEQFLSYGKHLLSKSKSSTSPNASDLLSEALDICEKGISATGKYSKKSELEALKSRCLRFLSAERLHHEDFEGALKCVRVLRSSWKEDESEHPSVGYVAMKGWLGIGNVPEGEKELMRLVKNKEAAESVVVAAAEEYLKQAGAEAAPAVMVALAGRCRVGGAAAAVRVVKRVLEGGGGGGGKGRAKAAAELAADERIVGLFNGDESKRERGAMHALLWNCGAEHFRLQNLDISAELFERSMLYLSREEESRSRRANCFRVLTLCYLANSQLDRAREFINEADKLEPSITCAFLKFKIHLRLKEEDEAIKQLQSMLTYTDFHPEFLSISTHESLQNKSTRVAISSLSILLSLYSPGKSMPLSEVSVIRSLTTLLLCEPNTESEILKHAKLVRSRMVEIGVQSFFGKGASGAREINWFAGNCWNFGLKAGREMKHELCKDFFELAAEFYGTAGNFGDGINDANQAMICKCLILSVGALLSLDERKKGNLLGLDVKKGVEMLEQAGKLLSSLSADESINAGFHFLHTYNSYQLLNKSPTNMQRQQTQLIKSYASTKACTPHHLLQLGLTASLGLKPNLEAAEFAFRSSLTSLLSLHPPDYQSIGIILRKLASITSHSEDLAYEVYKQAYQIVVGLRMGEYPAEEGKWLAMSAWNISNLAVRLRQGEVARKWMKIGLDLARQVSGMEKYVANMEECLQKFETVCNGERDGDESGANHQLVLV